MNTDKGETMAKISAIGKYLDQPLLISKLNKSVPYILSGFAGGYLINDVHKTPKEERRKEGLKTAITLFCTILSAIAAPKIASKLTKRNPFPSSCEVINRNKELVNNFISENPNTKIKGILEKSKNKVLSLCEVSRLFKMHKEFANKLIPPPENIQELLPWQKKFPDIYYQELFRLNGWDFTVKGIKKRPSCIGRWTNTIIYEQLPQDVLKTLKERTPKSENGNRLHRFHQLLTFDIGDPNLNAQIQQILALFKISDNMEQFWQHFAKLQDRNKGQLQLPFVFDKKGHTISPNEHNDLSEFDKNIKKALNYNPNND